MTQWYVCEAVTVFQVILVGSNLKETLQQASLKFGEEVVELRSPKGGVIDDVSLLRYCQLVCAIIVYHDLCPYLQRLGHNNGCYQR